MINHRHANYVKSVNIKRSGTRTVDTMKVVLLGRPILRTGMEIDCVIDRVDPTSAYGIYTMQYGIHDESGYANDGTVSGGVTYVHEGRHDMRCAQIPVDGTITLGVTPSYHTSWTLSFWVYRTSSDVSDIISHGTYWRLSGDGNVHISGGTHNIGTIPVDTWTLVTVRYDSPTGMIRFKINDGADTSISAPTGTAKSSFVFGGNREIRIGVTRFLYDTASDFEISQIYRYPDPRHIMRFGGTIEKVQRGVNRTTLSCASWGSQLNTAEVIKSSRTSDTAENMMVSYIAENTSLIPVNLISTPTAVLGSYIGDKKVIEVLTELSTLGLVDFFVTPTRHVIIYKEQPRTFQHTLSQGKVQIDDDTDDLSQTTNDLIVVPSGVTEDIFTTGRSGTPTISPSFGMTQNEIQNRVNDGSFNVSLIGTGVDVQSVTFNLVQDYYRGSGRSRYRGTHSFGLSSSAYSVSGGILRLTNNAVGVIYGQRGTGLPSGQGIITNHFTNRDSGYVTVSYSYDSELPPLRGQIDDPQLPHRSVRITAPQFGDVDTARQLIKNELLRRGKSSKSVIVTIRTITTPYLEGDVVPLSNPVRKVQGEHVIRSISISYPQGITKLECDNPLYSSLEHNAKVVEKIHTLESLTTQQEVQLNVTERTVVKRLGIVLKPSYVVDGIIPLKNDIRLGIGLIPSYVRTDISQILSMIPMSISLVGRYALDPELVDRMLAGVDLTPSYDINEQVSTDGTAGISLTPSYSINIDRDEPIKAGVSLTPSYTVSAVLLPAPARVFTLVQNAPGTVIVYWNTVAGANGYRVTYYPTANSDMSSTREITNLILTLTGLTSGTQYTMVVQAYETVSGENVYGNPTTVTVTPN